MKTLVVYYSRTGTTAKIAKEIAENLKCDLEEIHDTVNRQGILRWFLAGRDGSLKKTTVIEKTKFKPSGYDRVIIGTPIWVNTTPAIRTYLIENANKFKTVAFFCTMGGKVSRKLFREMEQLTGKKPVAVMGLRYNEVANGTYKNTLKEFITLILNK